MPKPTREQIQEAGRQLQRGGFLGRGGSKLADAVMQQAKEAGMDVEQVAFGIMSAAAEYQPLLWAR